MPLELVVGKTRCYRYDLVPITVTVRDPKGRAIAVSPAPTVRILRGSEPVSTVGHVEVLPLRLDKKEMVYRGLWPVPWNAAAGVYVAEVRRALSVPEAWQWDQQLRTPKPQERKTWVAEAVARAEFRVVGRRPAKIAPGTCAVTWEPHPPRRKLRSPDGELVEGYRALVDWAEFMGADMIWVRGAVTEAGRGQKLTAERPFIVDYDGVREIAREAHKRGMKFGAWVVAYATLPFNRPQGKPPYRYAINEAGSPRRGFVSLLDDKRPKDIARVLRRLAEDPNVDMVGMDYFRPGPDGYEIVDQFVHAMPVAVPDGFFDWPQAKRRMWVANKVERQWRRDRDFYDQWNWYRAHLTSQRLREIREAAQLDKPLWVFIFGWARSQQAGQDPIMFTDAGADALAVMLYQCESVEHFELMTRQWHEYVRAGQTNLLPGDQVDFYWHQKMTRPRAAPEELFRRIVVANMKFQSGGVTTGAFWHDLSRAIVRGSLGPYPGREWALAGAAAFSVVRRKWQVYPVAGQVLADDAVPVGAPFTVHVALRNLVEAPVNDVEVSLEKTAQVESLEREGAKYIDLPAGSQAQVRWRLRITAADPRRGNRFMLAFRIRWPEGDYGEKVRNDLPRTIVVMKYVDGR